MKKATLLSRLKNKLDKAMPAPGEKKNNPIIHPV